MKSKVQIFIGLCKLYNEKPCVYRTDNGFRISISNIDKLKNKQFLLPLEGNGNCLNSAINDFFINAMDKNFTLRYNRDIIATFKIRDYIESEMRDCYDNSIY